MRKFSWLALGFLAVAAPALAADVTCSPAALVLATALPSCSYGPPVISGESVLIPKVCLHDSKGHKVLRHSVEARSLASGARQNQAALPAQATATDALPPPGTVLPGTPALLVIPQGIAACDFQRGAAELVFESQGGLIGAARNGDALALVEALPAESKGKPARLEWTVLDLEAGGVLGQVLLAGHSIEGLALQRTGAALTAVLWQANGGRLQEVQAAVYSDSGQLSAKNGDMPLRIRVVATAPAPTVPWPQAGACPTAVGDRGALVGKPTLVIGGSAGQPQGRGAHADPAQVARLLWTGPQPCLGAVLAPGAVRGAAWLRTASGAAELRAIHCSSAPAPSPN